MEQQQWKPEDKQPLPPQQQQQQQQNRPRLQCPRCESYDTKFCYYNNYSLAQPRYFCRTCKRFWTQGGTLRNIPEGGRRKKAKTNSSSMGASSSAGKAPIMHAAILDNQVPVFAGGVGINSFHAYYYGSVGSSSAVGGQAGDLNPGAITGNLTANSQSMTSDLCIMRPLVELHLQRLVQQPPRQASLPVQQNLMSNGDRGQGPRRPAGLALQEMGAQQLPVAHAFSTAPATAAAPASVPTTSSATSDAEVPNWDCILDPSVSLAPSPSPPPPSSAFM